MSSILESIAPRLSAARIGQVLHMGAGSTLDPLYSSPGWGRIVLVEGSEPAAALLRGQVGQGHVEVVHAVAASHSGAAQWFSCSLPSLSGLVEPSRWQTIYPRLAVVAKEEVEATGFADLVIQHVPHRSADQKSLLLLDVPGMETLYVDALPEELLHRFEWIAIRDGSMSSLSGAGSPISAAASLARRDYRIVLEDYVDPLWPTTLLQLDFERLGERRRFEAVLAEKKQMDVALCEREARIAALCATVEALQNERLLLLDDNSRLESSIQVLQDEKLEGFSAESRRLQQVDAARQRQYEDRMSQVDAQIELITSHLLGSIEP